MLINLFFQSSVKGFDRPLSEYLPLDDWGATVAPKDIQIDWNIPGILKQDI